MRRTSILATISRAFYSKKIYREVGRDWSGFGFDYLIIIISILTFPMIAAAIMYSVIIRFDKTLESNSIINQIPDITIKHGEVYTDVHMPYYVKYDGTTQVMAIVDTTRPVQDWMSQMKEYGLVLVVGKEQIVFKKRGASVEKILFDIPYELNIKISSGIVRRLSDGYLNNKLLALPIISIFTVSLLFLCAASAMLIFGVCGKIMSLVMRADLSYKDCVRLASVSATATFALITITLMFNINMSVFAYSIVGIAYLFYAIKANKYDAI